MDIKQVIKRKGLTIDKVAGSLGITQSALSQQINNKTISLVRAKAIADVLGIPLSELVADETEKFTALIRYRGKLYSADSLQELKSLISEFDSPESNG